MADAKEKEVWRKLPEFPGYQINNHGLVQNLILGHYLHQRYSDGMAVFLYKDGQQHHCAVRDLVESAFPGEDMPGSRAAGPKKYRHAKTLKENNNDTQA